MCLLLTCWRLVYVYRLQRKPAENEAGNEKDRGRERKKKMQEIQDGGREEGRK